MLTVALGIMHAGGWWRPAMAAVAIVRCTNPYSGAGWDLTIDYDYGIVDSFPARVTKAAISWQDTLHGGYYSLDRGSGALTVTYPSSTGGFLLHDKCELP